ncbi:MAG: magnesium chelatase subunit D family protein [Clostridia bacterium]|nr:magnesium chelatase subunit D family protein [Oscillospiraceae bacterium]MBR6574569.1 magnesium chelatase subunit D family protein [Clostridia bacterium]
MTDLRYPFAAIVGQEQVKKALLYNLIEPRIGGVLLCGEKGTAKSTIVRGLAALTEQKVVDLPLSITEDMLVGAIDFEKAVKEGVKAFSGGVLERAHENILYVDEVNLLPDGIVSTLICAAASGENLVEREGISFRHDCRFVLVGTMNPEEGKLRPQFLDRFGLYVEVVGEPDLEIRTEIIRRRMDYERKPVAFCEKWQAESLALRKKIQRAKALVEDVVVEEDIRQLAANYARQAGTEGNRCEVVLIRTAAAVAAWNGRDYITAEDLKEAAVYVLPHRQRQEPPPMEEEPPQSPQQEQNTEQDGQEEQKQEQPSQMPEQEPEYEAQDGNDGEEVETPPPETNEGGSSDKEQLVEGENVALLSLIPAIPRDRLLRQGSGRRSKTKSGANKGRYAAFTAHPTPRQHDLALDATLRVAAPYQSQRDHSDCAVALTDADLRFKVREDHVGATIVFAVDASGSMGAQKRMKAAKEAILSMLLDSYQKRDRIGLVAFRKEGAQTLLDITASVDLAQKKLQELPTGGRTPLAAGLYQSWQLLKARRLKDPELLPMLVLVTDGRANRSLWTEDAVADALRAAELIRQDHIHTVVVDTEKEFISLHIARQLADVMDAAYYKVDDLKAEQLQTIVKSRSILAGLDV